MGKLGFSLRVLLVTLLLLPNGTLSVCILCLEPGGHIAIESYNAACCLRAPANRHAGWFDVGLPMLTLPGGHGSDIPIVVTSMQSTETAGPDDGFRGMSRIASSGARAILVDGPPHPTEQTPVAVVPAAPLSSVSSVCRC